MTGRFVILDCKVMFFLLGAWIALCLETEQINMSCSISCDKDTKLGLKRLVLFLVQPYS